MKPEAGVNVAFTYAGLQALGVPDATLAELPRRSSARAWPSRAELLGDTGDSAPGNWEAGSSTPGSTRW